MKTITSKSPHGSSSFSFSRRYFNLKKKVEYDDDDKEEDEEEEEEILTTLGSSSRYFCEEELRFASHHGHQLSLVPSLPTPRKHLQLPTPTVAVSKLRSALGVFAKNRSSSNRGSGSGSGLGTKVIGTLFGYRRGHVHFAFQEGAKSSPAFLIQLATPTSVLVREMASGMVRVALECDKKKKKKNKNKAAAGAGGGGRVKLLEEPVWRAYCNGKKCGFAVRRECGEEEWKVLFKALEPISMGAGVLPLLLTLPPPSASDCNIGNGNGWEQLGELMYMRARFERVVGSKDSEAFYMMNPDGSGGPELSVYLLRV